MSDSTTDLEIEIIQSRKRTGLFKRFERVLAMFRYYRWEQIGRRAFRVAKQQISKGVKVGNIALSQPLSRKRDLGDAFQMLAHAIVSTESPTRCSWDGASQQLSLLNTETPLDWPINWEELPQGKPHLWYFQLHYHEFLLVLKNTPPTFAWEFIESWIDAYPPENTLQTDDSWHSYCISRRLPVWIWLLSLNQPKEDLEAKILRSIFQQADHLANNLELELGGNHLLENLTALAIAGLFLQHPTAAQWIETVKKLLRRELERQVLESGEHFERSPMYHCQVLGNLLRLMAISRETDQELFELIASHAVQMLGFLGKILHPDGKIPLFADSGFDEAPSVKQISRIAEILGLKLEGSKSAERIGNYFVFTSEEADEFLIFDAGDVGAEELPAHAHCDLLNFELSVGKNRWIVDSGNYNYENDSMRAYCRSSLAHNVPTISGKSSCDVWSKFRMGRRGKIVYTDSNSDQLEWCIASHDGYRPFGVDRISRAFIFDRQNSIITCVDHTDHMASTLISYIHLSPDLETEKVGDCSFRLRDDSGNRRSLSFFGAEKVEIVTGWYCPSFGTRIKNQIFRYRRQPGLMSLGWSFGPKLNDCEVKLRGREVKIRLNDRLQSLSFPS